MSKNLIVKIFTSLFIVLLSACFQEDQVTLYPLDEIPGKLIVLGKKLENPYRPSVMKKALENIRKERGAANGREISELNIRTTTLYIRFLPTDYSQYDNLIDSSIGELYEYPLDYEILVEGDFYHDPTIPASNPTWQYAAIEVGQQLPSHIRYEVIDELYLPEDDYDILENGVIREIYIPTIEAMEEEALILTGNGSERITAVARTMGSWRPSGRIQMFDDRLNRNVPVVGAKVNARRWFTTHTGFTDINGNFSCNGTFRRPANYSIKWERDDWDIRSGTFGQAIFNGPKIEGSWNLIITGGMSRLYAIVHTALNDYYYGARFGLKSPPKNSFWKSKMKIPVYDEDEDVNGSHCKDCRAGGILPRLRIYSRFRQCDEIYGTTIHELAHSSHWELRRNNWNDNNLEKRVKESWAEGVEWSFVLARYMACGDNDPARNDNFQRRGTSNPNNSDNDAFLKAYTPIVVDLIDNENQRLTRTPLFGINLPIDQVTGYTILQIENTLSSSGNFAGWRNQLFDRYNNPTEANLTELFNNW
jgi:hypothetical protein